MPGVDIFKRLDAEFHFTLDAAATVANARCKKFCTADGYYDGGKQKSKEDGLTHTWAKERVYANCPGGVFRDWVAKAASSKAAVAVLLLPQTPSADWFHEFIWDGEKNRTQDGIHLRFYPDHPAMVVVFER